MFRQKATGCPEPASLGTLPDHTSVAPLGTWKMAGAVAEKPIPAHLARLAPSLFPVVLKAWPLCSWKDSLLCSGYLVFSCSRLIASLSGDVPRIRETKI